MPRQNLDLYEKAIVATLTGGYKSAIPQFKKVIKSGNTSACIPLAEIYAFSGKWKDCISTVEQFLLKPSPGFDRYVSYCEMIDLVKYAGRHSLKWNSISQIVSNARKSRSGRTFRDYLDELAEYARTRGTACVQRPNPKTDFPEYGDEKEFAKTRKRYKLKSHEDLLHFAIACGIESEALRYYKKTQDVALFDHALFLARALARASRYDEAWEIVEKHLHLWMPQDITRILPVELLTDPVLDPMMTRERCEAILLSPPAPFDQESESDQDDIGLEAVIYRTDFTNDKLWKKLQKTISVPYVEFEMESQIEFISDPANANLTPKQLLKQIPKDTDHACCFIVDESSLTDKDHPILVMDLAEKRGRTFRVIPSALWSIQSNLSIANMDWKDFSTHVGKDGIFRGFDY